jgi:hypothetical protein
MSESMFFIYAASVFCCHFLCHKVLVKDYFLSKKLNDNVILISIFPAANSIVSAFAIAIFLLEKLNDRKAKYN